MFRSYFISTAVIALIAVLAQRDSHSVNGGQSDKKGDSNKQITYKDGNHEPSNADISQLQFQIKFLDIGASKDGVNVISFYSDTHHYDVAGDATLLGPTEPGKPGKVITIGQLLDLYKDKKVTHIKITARVDPAGRFRVAECY